MVKTDVLQKYKPNAERYFNSLQGKINFILQIEPDDPWFAEAKNKLKKL